METKELRRIFKNNLVHFLGTKDEPHQRLADAVGVSSGTLSDWVQGNAYPRPEHIAAIAEYFNINPGDLTNDPNVTNKLSRQEQEILDLYKSIPSDKQAFAFNFLKTLKVSE